jgi:hypothetical protein
VAEIRNDTMKSNGRRCAACAAPLNRLRRFAVAEIHG